MVVLQLYSSLLTASLSSYNEKYPFSSLQELVTNPNYKIGIRFGGSNVEYLQVSPVYLWWLYIICIVVMEWYFPKVTKNT